MENVKLMYQVQVQVRVHVQVYVGLLFDSCRTVEWELLVYFCAGSAIVWGSRRLEAMTAEQIFYMYKRNK